MNQELITELACAVIGLNLGLIVSVVYVYIRLKRYQ